MEDLLEVLTASDAAHEEVEEAILAQIMSAKASTTFVSSKYPRMDFSSLSTEESRSLFRFEKHDLPRLRTLLGIPDRIYTNNDLQICGLEAFCILLRRLAYPNRLADLEQIFGLSVTSLSIICKEVVKIIVNKKGHLLEDLSKNTWFTKSRLELYSEAIHEKGAPLTNCWGFIDGTAQAICRPKRNQKLYFSGHKRFHCVKYQSIIAADGIIVSLHGGFQGRRHDAGIFRESGIYSQLQQHCKFEDKSFVIYGDPAYPIKELVLCPYGTVQITPPKAAFNSSMSRVRQAVEWGFGKVVQLFAFLDFKKNQKLLLQEVEKMYKCAVILSNCHSCLYRNQTALYFKVDPPSLEEYLS